MPKIAYEQKNFRAASLERIAQANEIIEEYRRQGFTLTLRQLYYQFVARGYLGNTQKNYKALGQTINDARLAGLIDWNAIEDRTRNLQRFSHWDAPEDIVRDCVRWFAVDLWEHQGHAPEVWIEKEALVGVIAGVCEEEDVPYFACRGYVSQSEQWRAGMRFARARKDGREPLVLHLGDHDPSGIDMTRDNEDRLRLFASHGVEVKRLALNMDQVEEYEPPPNPAKVTDSRFDQYVERYGGESWELDALEPTVIARLIRDALAPLIDEEQRREDLDRQERGRDQLGRISDRFEEVVEFIDGIDD